MTIARITEQEMVEMPIIYSMTGISEVYVIDLLRDRGIEFKRGRRNLTAIPEDMVSPWMMYREPQTGDLVVRQGEDAR